MAEKESAERAVRDLRRSPSRPRGSSAAQGTPVSGTPVLNVIPESQEIAQAKQLWHASELSGTRSESLHLSPMDWLRIRGQHARRCHLRDPLISVKDHCTFRRFARESKR